MSDVTKSFEKQSDGGLQKADELLPLVYTELRRLASAKMALQGSVQTLQPTALVHEAWLKLAGNPNACWKDREHFLRAAAEAMRQILVDRARAKARLKRGRNPTRVDFDDVQLATETPPEVLLIVDEALQSLAAEDPEKAELVKLRFYTGLNVEATGQTLGMSEKTVKRRWTHARAWLFREIQRLIQEKAR